MSYWAYAPFIIYFIVVAIVGLPIVIVTNTISRSGCFLNPNCVCSEAALKRLIDKSRKDPKEITVCIALKKIQVTKAIDITNASFSLTCRGKILGCGFLASSDSDENPQLFVGSPATNGITLRNLAFENFGSSTNNGGVIAFSSGTLMIQSCGFLDTRANNGGAIYLDDTASLILDDVYFSDAFANSKRGAIYAIGNSSVTIISSGIKSIEAGNNGGGIYAAGGSSIVLSDTAFGSEISYATANNGGAIYLEGTASLILDDAYLSVNTANSDGGAIYATGNSSVTVIASVIKSNEAGNNGGVFYATGGSSILLDDSYIHSNFAGSKGGAVYLQDSSNLIVEFVALDWRCSPMEDNFINSGSLGGDYLYAATGSIVDMRFNVTGFCQCPEAKANETGYKFENNTALIMGGATFDSMTAACSSF